MPSARQRPNQRKATFKAERKQYLTLLAEDWKTWCENCSSYPERSHKVLKRFYHTFNKLSKLNLGQQSLPSSKLFWAECTGFYSKSSMPRCWFCCSNNSNHLMWLLFNPDRLSRATISYKRSGKHIRTCRPQTERTEHYRNQATYLWSLQC